MEYITCLAKPSMGYLGKRGYNPSKSDYANGEKLHPELQKRIDRTKEIASSDVNNPYREKGSYERWSVDNTLKNSGDMGGQMNMPHHKVN